MWNLWTLLETWWSEWSAWWIGAIVSVLAVLGIGGCGLDAAINSGPKMMTTIGEGATAIGKTLLTKFDPQEMMARSSGEINDPRFYVRGVGGPVFLFEMEFGLDRVDMDYSIAASGQGIHDIPLEVTREAAAIWGNAALGEEERKNQIVALLANWITSQGTKVPSPIDKKDEPPSDPTDEKATDDQARADGAFTVAMGPPAPHTVTEINGADAQRVTFWNGEEVFREP